MLLLLLVDDDEPPRTPDGASLTIPRTSNQITLPIDAVEKPPREDAPAE